MAQQRIDINSITPGSTHQLFKGLQEIGYIGVCENGQRLVKRGKSSKPEQK
jgi:hypothetical protein